MTNLQGVIKEYYEYVKSIHKKYEEAFQVTSNELIDIRLVLLVIKGYSKEYYTNPNEDIFNEFKEESKKYVNSINTIKQQCNELKRQLSVLIKKRIELEDISGYSHGQDELVYLLKSIQKDFEDVYPILENDIFKVQLKLNQQILKYGVNPTDEFKTKDMEALYEKALKNIQSGMAIANKGNKKIKNIKEKIDELNEHYEIEKIEVEEKYISSVDERITLSFNKDKTEAYIKLNIQSKDPRPIKEDSVKQILDENGVKYGIINRNIAEICLNKPKNKVIVAKGRKPGKGKDASIEYKVDLFHKDAEFEVDEDSDRVDFKQTHTYDSIQPGTLLAEKFPPRPGERGISVQNEIIESKPGKDMDLKIGEGVELRDNGTKAISTIAGLPILSRGGEIEVTKLLVINSDVDYSTGNINFSGDILIRGDILDDFEVTGGENIKILGNIYHARVESLNGNIKLEKGISGDGNAFVKAKGSISAKFIEGAKVYCGGDMIVHTDIMHSTIYVNGKIVCCKGKGLVSGGYIGVGKSLECNVLGSKSYTPTKIDLGVDMDLRKEQYNTLLELNEIKNYITKARELLEKIKNKYGSGGKKISKRNYRRYINIKRAHNNKVAEFNYVKDELEKLEKKKIEALKNARLIVRKVTYPKVTIIAGKNQYAVKVEKDMPLVYKYKTEDKVVASRRLKIPKNVLNKGAKFEYEEEEGKEEILEENDESEEEKANT